LKIFLIEWISICPHRVCDQAFSIGTSFLFGAMPKAKTMPTGAETLKSPRHKRLKCPGGWSGNLVL
jgi:hypothetical protein